MHTEDLALFSVPPLNMAEVKKHGLNIDLLVQV